MVIQIFSGAKDSSAQLAVDVGAVIDDAGNCAHSDTRAPGDVSNRYGSMSRGGAASGPREPFHQITCCDTWSRESIQKVTDLFSGASFCSIRV